MVHVLPPPEVDSIGLINDVIAERQNGVNAVFFNGIAAEWLARVQAYLDHHGSAALVEKWPAIAADKTKFIGLYKHPAEGSAQGMVLENLRAHELVICPACGEAGRPNTLDHYLPKGVYPQFAIVPQNLFPMCDACQGAKLELTGDAQTPRFFIHPYYDRFSAPEVVSLRIHAPFDTPTFELIPNPNLMDDERTLVGVHIEKLEIISRFATFFSGAYRRVLRLAGEIRSGGQNMEAMLSFFRGNARAISPNSWDCIVYDAVLPNAELMEYLTDGELPTYL
ncbi:hypothetical protein E0H68_03350 [Rhizobium leguminosarum bv. viciae]|uniref:hypothetical protein n=1 Tax=Rhizobium leguminosarum TaxID=384 RepID=UPI00103CDE9D|nr:hypothetical protein [Rhizobium leguminosarum]TCA18485.1 hypothetical protein E0H68_03350 [Rhizobium leguminosarum bv. viciae]